MERALNKRGNPKRIIWILAAVLVAALALEGRQLAHFLPSIEHFVKSLGPWGPLILIASILILEPLLFPNSLFGLMAGAVFGFPWGFLYYASGVYVGNLLVYLIARSFLRRPVLGALERRPEVQAAVTAAKREGASLVFWLRLLPINPALFSYAFGAVELPLRAFALGSLGMFSHLLLDAYMGSVAALVTEMAGHGHRRWEIEGIALVIGLIALGIVIWRLVRIAKAQIDKAGVRLEA